MTTAIRQHGTIPERGLPPGPRLPAAAQAIRWALRPGAFLERCQRNHGDVFAVHLDVGRAPRVLIADPEVAERLLTKPSLTAAPSTRTSIAPVFGEESVLLANGEDHQRRRRPMLPAFQGGHLDRYRELIVAATDREIETWPLGREFALRPRLQAITLEVILDAIFGFRDGASRARMGEHVDRLLGVVANRGAALAVTLPSRLRTMAARGPLASRRAEMDAAVFAEMARWRAGHGVDAGVGNGECALSYLMSAGDDEGEGLTDQEVCDQVRTLLLAGHESTATSLAWSLEHLVHEPRVFDRLCAEVNSIGLGDGAERYADAVVTETLRLSPPLPIIQRELTEPWTVGEYTLPAKTLVAPCGYLIHRRADLYPNPHAFEPERFLAHGPAPHAWLPFGGGPRRCLGANFARLQMTVVLGRLFQRTRLRAASPRRETIRRRGIVFAPSRGARVVMVERRAA